jgi:hypothetical protein
MYRHAANLLRRGQCLPLGLEMDSARVEAAPRMQNLQTGQPAGFAFDYCLANTLGYGVTVVANTSVGFDRSPEFVWTKKGRKVVNAVSNP